MKKILLTLVCTLFFLASFAQSQFSGIILYVTDSATYRASSTVTNAHSSGKSDIYWNAQATTPHYDWWNGASYSHGFGSGGGGGGWALTGTTTITGDVVIDGASGNHNAEFYFDSFVMSTDVAGFGFDATGADITGDTGFAQLRAENGADDVLIKAEPTNLTLDTDQDMTWRVIDDLIINGASGTTGQVIGNVNGVPQWETPSYIYDQASPSTAGGTITLDMNSLQQRSFVGSASFSTDKTIAMSNVITTSGVPVFFNFFFEVTSITGVEIIVPSDWAMSSSNFDGTDWEPPAIGKYEFGGSYDNTNDLWYIKVSGPFEN